MIREPTSHNLTDYLNTHQVLFAQVGKEIRCWRPRSIQPARIHQYYQYYVDFQRGTEKRALVVALEVAV
jgi:hypothetical protein